MPPRFAQPDARAEPAGPFDVERARVRLADVGEMQKVKARLEAAVLAPMRNPELGRLYGKSLRGGLRLYGPPGCGKAFLARALAGELDAAFLSVSLSDVLDGYHLRGRPMANIDTAKLARAGDGYSGADLAHICEAAAKHARLESAQSGAPRDRDA